MNKKTAFIIAGVFVLLISTLAVARGSFIAQLGNAISQFAAAALGNSAGTAGTVSAAALAANGLYELKAGDYAVITQQKGALTGIKKKVVATLPGGELYTADVDKNTTIQIIPYKKGAHIAVPASDANVAIHNQFDELTGYDENGVANAVNKRVERTDTADVIVTMKLPSKQYFNASDTASTRATKKAQFNSAKNSIVGAMGAGGEITHELPIINGLAIRVNARALDGLAKNPNVQRIDPDLQVRAFLDKSADHINAPDAWSQTDANGKLITGEGIRIAVIDTGVDYTLADLGGCFGATCKVEDGWDFVNNDSDPKDDQGHGTHVAATAAGIGMVGTTNLSGVAPGAHILAYKVLSSSGSGSSSNVIAGINRAADPNNDGDTADHVDIISMSLGRSCYSYSSTCGPTDSVSIAVDNATAAGVVSAIAAGNSGPYASTVGSPATAATAVTVAAGCAPHGDLSTSRCPNGNSTPIASFSSRGPVVFEGTDYKKPDITAPGVMICAARWGTAFSTSPDCFNSGHVRISGTSMATPHIAGVLALMKQAYPSETPVQLKARIKAAATDLGGGMTYNDQGAGLVDVQKIIIDISKVTASPSSWTVSTNPTTKYSKTTQSFTVSSKDASITRLAVGFTAPDPGITFTSSTSSLSVAGGVSASFTGTIQVDNDVVQSGEYTGVITLKDSAGKVQGSISVPITVLSTIAATPTGTLDYGFDNPSLSTWSSALIPVTITNLRSDIAQTVTATPPVLISGVTYKLSPSPVTIPAGGSAIVNTGVTVTNSSVANGFYTGSILFSSAVASVTVPTTFTKFHVLTIQDTVDPSNGNLSYIELYDRSSFYSSYYYVNDNSLTLYFDNPSSFDAKIRFGYASGFSDRLLLKEGVQVNGVTTLSVNGSQATRRVQLVGTDINGKNTTYPIRLSFGSNFYSIESDLKYVSDVSANYSVRIDADPYAMYSGVTSPFYMYGGTVQGIASNISITNTAASLKKTVFPISVNRVAGSEILTGIYMCPGSLDICYGFASGYATSTPYEHVVYSTSPFTYFYLVADENRGGCSSSPPTPAQVGVTSHNTSACVNIFRSQTINPVSGEHFTSRLSDSSLPGVVPSRINMGLGPTAWFLKIRKVDNSTIVFEQPFAAPRSPLMRQDYATQEDSGISYTLTRDGTEVDTGTFPPWGVYSYAASGPLHYGYVPSAGRYNFKSTFSYQVQGLTFSGDVDSTFDTSRADPNPPYLKLFEYLTNGIKTDQYYSKSASSTLILALDPNSGTMSSVVVSYSLDGTTFTQVSVAPKTTAAGAGYVATIPALTTTGTSITLRFLATDASLNTLQYTFQLPVSTATPPGTTLDIAPPTVSLTSPASGKTVSGIIDFNAIASDNVGVTKVELHLGNGTLLGTDTTAPYSIAWDTASLPDAKRFFAAVAHDAAGNIATSSFITLTVQNAASPDGSTLSPGTTGSLTTAEGVWTFGTTVNTYGNAILRNGTSAASGYGVLLEVAQSGKMFTKNSLGLWYKWTGSAWQISTDPTPLSPDGSSITPTSGGSLTTAEGTWTFGTASNSFGRAILRNGTSAASGYGVLLEVAQSGKMFTKNAYSTWYKWTGSAWQSSTDPSPTLIPTVSFTASSSAIVSSQSTTLTWSSTGATSCTGRGFTGNGNSGSVIVKPTQTTTYSITCTGTGGTASKSTTVSVSPAPKFVLNDRIRATAPVNVRSSASATASLLGTEATSSLGTVIGGPQNGGGSTWWNVRWDNNITGWSVQAYLQKVAGTASLPTDGTVDDTNIAVTAASASGTSQFAAVLSVLRSMLIQVEDTTARAFGA